MVKSQYGSEAEGAIDWMLFSNRADNVACCVRKPVPSCMWSQSRLAAIAECIIVNSFAVMKFEPYVERPSSALVSQSTFALLKNRLRSSSSNCRNSRLT